MVTLPAEVLAQQGTDNEDHELEDAEHEAVLCGGGSFVLSLFRVEGRL